MFKWHVFDCAGTINQGTREHRCRYGHHEIKMKKKD